MSESLVDAAAEKAMVDHAMRMSCVSLRARLHLLSLVSPKAVEDFSVAMAIEDPVVVMDEPQPFDAEISRRVKDGLLQWRASVVARNAAQPKLVCDRVVSVKAKPVPRAPSIQTGEARRSGTQRSGPKRKMKVLAVRSARRRFARDWRASSEVYRIMNGA